MFEYIIEFVSIWLSIKILEHIGDNFKKRNFFKNDSFSDEFVKLLVFWSICLFVMIIVWGIFSGMFNEGVMDDLGMVILISSVNGYSSKYFGNTIYWILLAVTVLFSMGEPDKILGIVVALIFFYITRGNVHKYISKNTINSEYNLKDKISKNIIGENRYGNNHEYNNRYNASTTYKSDKSINQDIVSEHRYSNVKNKSKTEYDDNIKYNNNEGQYDRTDDTLNSYLSNAKKYFQKASNDIKNNDLNSAINNWKESLKYYKMAEKIAKTKNDNKLTMYIENNIKTLVEYLVSAKIKIISNKIEGLK